MSRYLSILLALSLALALAGCAHKQARLQSDDDTERGKEPALKTIGDVTEVACADAVPVSGIGLVMGLDATGGSPPPGAFRTMLEDQLRKRGVENVKDILASPNTSMVLVSGLIPAGAQKGELFDVEVALPEQSRTTSLRGGYLKECILMDYNTTKNLDPNYAGANQLKMGHPLARAEGRILTGFGDGDETARQKQGRIWNGGRSQIDRPLQLVFTNAHQRAPIAQRVAARINETFHGAFRGALFDVAVATAPPPAVALKVPQQYKQNMPRYLRVIRLIPLANTPAPSSSYRRQLEEQLLDPAHSVTAALRLEALGGDSIPVLKKGLTSSHPLVRFCSAEALAYLGSPSCGEELARLVEQQPALRAFGLTALASLDEAVCHVKLGELLSAQDQETRYGAFRALRALDENETAVKGELVNNAFWLHRVAPHSPSLIHVSCTRRAEVVLFGEEPGLVPPFSFLVGEFTVTANEHDDHCTVSRFSVRHGAAHRQCALKLEEVLRTLADLGGMYSDTVDLLRQAGSCQGVSCQVAVDALPQATSVFELAKRGAEDPEFLKTDQEILNARQDFGATPNLFERAQARRPRPGLSHDDMAGLRKRKTDDGKSTAQHDAD